jgi:hypothetical protein
MNKTIAEVEKQLRWYADQEGHHQQAAALAGIAMIDAVRKFDESSGRLSKWMLWLTVAIGALTVIQIVITVVPLLRH